jgi:hypothetical protein
MDFEWLTAFEAFNTYTRSSEVPINSIRRINMSFLDDAISTIGRGLAQTAVHAISDETGYDVGGTMNALFGNGQTTGGQNIMGLQENISNPSNWNGTFPDLLMLQQGVTQQIQQILNLTNMLGSINTEIGVLSGYIQSFEALLIQIDQQQIYQAWSTVDGSLNTYLSDVQAYYSTYAGYLADLSTSTGLVDTFAGECIDPSGPYSAVEGISRLIMDQGQSKGALQLWSNMVVTTVNAGLVDYRDAVNQYVVYYKTLAYCQLQATNLVMEGYIFSRDKTAAASAWNTYRQAMLDQEAIFITWLIPLIAAGQLYEIGKYTGQNGSYSYTAIDATMQINPAIQQPLASSDPTTAYYGPSSILKNAEALLASLYVTKALDRRIVVHLVYASDPMVSNVVSGAPLTLTNVSDSNVVPSGKSQITGGPFIVGNSVPLDINLYYSGTPGFYLKRFVFFADDQNTALADGSYQLTDINNQNGLVPINTYVADDLNFMNGNVLNYVLTVSSSKPFDFMNFMAYMTPVQAIW